MPRFFTRSLAHRSAAIALACCPLPQAAAADCPIPVTGCETPYLAPLDNLMSAFMCDRDIPGATLAIMKDGVVVYERGFGWKDQSHTTPMPPDALMRIASVSKPITAAAIRELLADGLLAPDTHAFDLGQPGGGVLPHQPFQALGDERLKDITIYHLLLHRAGWNRSIAGDLTYMEVAIANAMGIPSPPGRDDTLRYILSQPLQSTPGIAERYSNIGYLVLGMIVEEITGTPLIDFIHERVLEPLGVPDSEHQAGRTFAADQSPREPYYEAPGLITNVYNPNGPPVRLPYGGWDHEARVGQGGQITTARTLLAFLDARYIAGTSIGAPLPATRPDSFRNNHTGSLNGTESLARQRGDGIHYAVIFTNRAAGTSHASAIRAQLDALFDSGAIQWPDTPAPPCANPNDINHDGAINFFDLAAMIEALGPCADCTDCPADLTHDCQVNFFDLATLLDAFQ